MNAVLREYLFNKNILVEYKDCEQNEQFQALFALARNFYIDVSEGKNYACMKHVEFASESLGENVPKPFYQGFPESVKSLSPDQLLFDQLFHYFQTYGLGDFSTPGESYFDREFKRVAFAEKAEVKKFIIISEEDSPGVEKSPKP